MKLVDTHAHIYLEQFDEDLDEVIGRAREAGVEKIFMPNIDSSSIDRMLEMEQRFPDFCIPMMGLHPCSVKADFEKELYLVEDWLAKRRFVAVGEMGTDLYWDQSFFEQQKAAFKIQCELAMKYEVPIVIHCRSSFDETVGLLEELNRSNLTGVFHCFTGSVEDAKRVAALGFKVGLGGVATFKKGGLDQVVPQINRTDIILETDSPYLAPTPYRGKRNEPAYVSLVAAKVAEYQQIDLEGVAHTTTQNALSFFKMSDELQNR